MHVFRAGFYVTLSAAISTRELCVVEVAGCDGEPIKEGNKLDVRFYLPSEDISMVTKRSYRLRYKNKIIERVAK